MDFDLTRLGDREFEHLSQALALQVLGPGVSVFGEGPDGGREATFEGRMRFPEPGVPWDGYGVVQAKFERRLVGGSADTDAFLRSRSWPRWPATGTDALTRSRTTSTEGTIMTDESKDTGASAAGATDPPAMPAVTDRATFQAELDRLRAREKAHTREGDAIAAARRRLPMVEVDANLTLTGPNGPLTLLEAFEGRRQLIAYYFMWYPGRPAPEQCEGCTWVTTQVTELSYLHSRDITYAVLCQGPYDESVRYRDFMGWEVPWYSAQPSLDSLLVGGRIGMMHLVCYLRDGDRVFETYWTAGRGVEVMDYSFALTDRTVYGRQEPWEDSPPGWPQPWGVIGDAHPFRTNGRPIAQWSRLEAGRSDDLTIGP